MTTMNTKQDFLRLLNGDAEFKAEVRRIILTEELLNVPAILREMAERQSEMAERQSEMAERQPQMAKWQAEMSERQAQMIKWQAEMTERQTQMSERQRRMQDDLGEIKGQKIEFRLERRIVSILSDLLNQRNGIIIRGGHHNRAVSEFNEAIYDAYKKGVIDDRERNRIISTDMVVRATNRESGEIVYSVVEASWVIDDNDVIRAHRSAEVVAKIYPGAKAEAVVYGATINDRGRDAAERLGVIVSDNASA